MEPGTCEAFSGVLRITELPVPEPDARKYIDSVGARSRNVFQSMGRVHPFVAVAFDSLGTLERARGDFANAERHEQRAVEIDEKFGVEIVKPRA
jgi:hypothetical protein